MEKLNLFVATLSKEDEGLKTILGLSEPSGAFYVETAVRYGETVEDGEGYKVIPNEEKQAKVDSYLQENFKVSYEDLDTLVGTEHEFYVNDDSTKASIYPMAIQADSIEESKGSKIEGVIEVIEKRSRGYFIGVRTNEGKLYKLSSFDTSKYLENLPSGPAYIPDKKKEEATLDAFEKVFNEDFETLPTEEELQKFIGKSVKTKVGVYKTHKFLGKNDTRVS